MTQSETFCQHEGCSEAATSFVSNGNKWAKKTLSFCKAHGEEYRSKKKAQEYHDAVIKHYNTQLLAAVETAGVSNAIQDVVEMIEDLVEWKEEQLIQ